VPLQQPPWGEPQRPAAAQGLQPRITLHGPGGEALGRVEGGGEFGATLVALSPDAQLLAAAVEEPAPGLALWAWRTVGPACLSGPPRTPACLSGQDPGALAPRR
jgi:hypothetical protein